MTAEIGAIHHPGVIAFMLPICFALIAAKEDIGSPKAKTKNINFFMFAILLSFFYFI